MYWIIICKWKNDVSGEPIKELVRVGHNNIKISKIVCDGSITFKTYNHNRSAKN